jgi:hypothetical protein
VVATSQLSESDFKSFLDPECCGLCRSFGGRFLDAGLVVDFSGSLVAPPSKTRLLSISSTRPLLEIALLSCSGQLIESVLLVLDIDRCNERFGEGRNESPGKAMSPWRPLLTIWPWAEFKGIGELWIFCGLRDVGVFDASLKWTLNPTPFSLVVSFGFFSDDGLECVILAGSALESEDVSGEFDCNLIGVCFLISEAGVEL